jgi:16S rRNA (cytosine967-C5)-methyltransferase
LRRHPDRRWKAEPAEIGTLAHLGSLLLAHSALLVRPGGFVVYSTCTVAREENEGVVEGFLDSTFGQAFAIDPICDEVPEVWRHFARPEGWLRSLPRTGGPDGHFVARLKRVDQGS